MGWWVDGGVFWVGGGISPLSERKQTVMAAEFFG